MNEQNETIAVDAKEHSAQNSPGVLSPDVSMVILTWVVFFLLLAVLYKYAWKPILAALDAREKFIRESVGKADQIRQELERVEAARKDILREAEQKSKEIIEHSRKAALEAAKVINEKARKEAQIIVENAQREIKEEVEKARADLRTESARIAVELAGRIIEENMDTEKNRKFINQVMKNI